MNVSKHISVTCAALFAAGATLIPFDSDLHAAPPTQKEKEELTELQYCLQSADAVRAEVVGMMMKKGCLKGGYQSQANATVCSQATVYKSPLGGPKPDPTEAPLAQIGPQPALNCYSCEEDPKNNVVCSVIAAVDTSFTLHLGAGYLVTSGSLDVKLKMTAALEWTDLKGPIALVKELKDGQGKDEDLNIVSGVIRPKFTYKKGTVMSVDGAVKWPSGSVEIGVGYNKSCAVQMSIDTWILPMPLGKKSCGDPPTKPGPPILSDPPECPSPTATSSTGTPTPMPTAPTTPTPPK